MCVYEKKGYDNITLFQTWQRTSNCVRLSISILVGFPDINLLPTVPRQDDHVGI
jgi:hypothetical protein